MTKTPSQAKVLITGGGGFIGSALCHRLNALGHRDITLVDRLGKTDKWRNLVGLQYAQYMEVDAFKAWRANHACDFDVVFALGACSSTRELDASYLMSNNLADMIELAHWALHPTAITHQSGYGSITYAASPARFIYASSSATYGSAGSLPASDDLSPHTLHPLNAYGLSKNAFDQYAEAHGWLDQIVGLKYTNVFGSGCEHKGDLISFPTKVYQDVRRCGYTTMYDTYKTAPGGPERDARDFLYVKDAVDMTIHFAFGRGAQAHGLFNLGAGVATSWREVAELTIKSYAEAGGKVRPLQDGNPIEYAPLPPVLAPKYQYYTCADITKLRASGYDKPITPIAEAISDYVTNYLVPDRKIGTAERARDAKAGAPTT